ncbi:LLM class flavin-dependent oxidoreductase [Microbacterium sp. M3]|uniref:LLM class flavin-dependent oxidoreductase n=1 Tax=Microbacterium arthrosphaerae TaxID=792652 RepID=A0ABU4GXE5_9MICO|nr:MULTISPECIES: LLM class flavin-dependent oxidoreductase [Microbacterium]MDW4571752.1 LLM class flavin-dependent oxidoreductase [Microbacterium arthrosphaerae]MDW7605607.1 LLM class flavin-dependent oxidoreductase [Microbacterium sp. M3]
MTEQVHIAIAFERAGWHPAAWREPTARPRELTSPVYWRDLLRTADDAGVALATIEDALSLPDRFEPLEGLRRDRVRGRLDAVLIASFVAPLTRRIGLVPTVTTTHPEPFHVATGIQTLDFASRGRAGVRLVAGASAAERANFGRRTSGVEALPASGRVEDSPEILAAFREAGEFADVLSRLWDSWQDDAIIRDAASGRFLDADRVHDIEFEGEFFSVTGASIVPRSPQGRPLLTVLAHQTVPYRLAAERADLVFVTPDEERPGFALDGIRSELDAAADELRTDDERLRVYADLLVLIEDTEAAARSALARLDELDGAPLTSDARIVVGTPGDVADAVRELAAAGVDGVRLRPARQPADVVGIAEKVVPLLRSTSTLREDDGAGTLRSRLDLARPESRYAREKVAL